MEQSKLSSSSGKNDRQQEQHSSRRQGVPKQPPKSPFIVRIGPVTFLLIAVGSSVLPFLLGQWILHHRPDLAVQVQRHRSQTPFSNPKTMEDSDIESSNQLPKIPLKHSSASLPQTTYSSKVIFRPSGSVHHWDSFDNNVVGTCPMGDTAAACPLREVNTDESSSVQHEPSGQHLLVDFENVDPQFLASEERLATAMVQLVEYSSLTMLSYHCHSYERNGVSCVGVLMESHVSIHSFPAFGILALDLFTCGRNNPVLPVIPYIEELFGQSGEEASEMEQEPPRMVWSHKRRGFNLQDIQNEAKREEFDYHWALGFTDYEKIQVIEEDTDFQTVQIVDIHDGDNLDRILYLDGVMQSRKRGEASYHEALVHPAMFVHPNPQRVAIIGGGEGATLREVLKHNTVEDVVMIEIDERLVEIAKEFLPEWNDCSFLVGRASCFDDSRATVVFEDAINFFLSRFGNGSLAQQSFDVIIMDALDPNSIVEFSDILYGNTALAEAFFRALGDQGVFVAQMGEADDFNDIASLGKVSDQFVSFTAGLEEAGFESLIEYTEAHGRFLAPWAFVVALKDSDSRARWYRNEAQILLDMKERSLVDVSGSSPFRFFDGATFMNYIFPNRIAEEIWCRRNGKECEGGHGFDPIFLDHKESSYTVGRSSVANGGRGVFATENIPMESYLGIEECVNGIFVSPTTFEILEDLEDEFADSTLFWATFYKGYIQGYGWEDGYYGKTGAGIETTLLTFVNHGCNKTYNIGQPTDVSELTVDLQNLAHQTFYEDRNDVFHPFDERHFPAWGCQRFKALRDIRKGEEILDNYMVFGGSDGDELFDYVSELKSMCNGGIGSVSQYELARERETIE